jgi:hypothetical protein
MNKKLQVLAALVVFSGFAQADDYAYPAAFVPVSANGNGNGNGHEESLGEPLSCKEARETAWFIRELSRSDGDTNPEVAYVPCAREILARSTADAD